MLNLALAVAAKDLRILLSSPAALCQPLLLGLLLIFIFSLAKAPGEPASPQEAAAIFWLASVFCQTLLFSQLYAIEEASSSRHGLLLAPAPAQAIWLGKAGAALLLLAGAQLVFLPAMAAFLAQSFSGALWPGAAGLGLADLGMAASGSLLGALASSQTGKEAVLSIILFPLLIPLLLAAISLSALTLGNGTGQAPDSWLALAAAFDCVFIGAGLALFGFAFQGGD